MEKLLMSSGVIASIILVLVGLIKTPIMKYKEKKWYKAVLTIITLALIIGVDVLCELFILELPLVSWDFAILLFMTTAQVFVAYNGVYEGFGLKDGVHKLIAHWKQLKNLSPEAKAVKSVSKVENDLIALYNLNKEIFNNTIISIRQKAENQKTE